MTKRGIPSNQPRPQHPDPWGETLRAERLARGWTQEALAEACGVSSGALGTWENGTNLAALIKWRRWADRLDYEIVLRRKGEP